jgi:transcriptional regulator with XRE-family HTH domain
MEMNVDAKRIRLERERRAWTQAQLAGATGLGLRTVQRIEREGSASFESVQAIAAALELAIADLRAEPRPDVPTAPTGSFPRRIAFAALSGAAVALYLDSRDGFAGFAASDGPLWSQLLDYLLPACMFAAAVLCPELQAGRRFVRRALALIAASSLSFFVAVSIALEAPRWLDDPAWSLPTPLSALLASAAGAGIVLIAARRLIGVERPARFWTVGVLAAALGGIAMYFGLALYEERFAITAASFAVWHMLLCFALRAGRPGPLFGKGSIRTALGAVRNLLPGGALWRSGVAQ